MWGTVSTSSTDLGNFACELATVRMNPMSVLEEENTVYEYAFENRREQDFEIDLNIALLDLIC